MDSVARQVGRVSINRTLNIQVEILCFVLAEQRSPVFEDVHIAMDHRKHLEGAMLPLICYTTMSPNTVVVGQKSADSISVSARQLSALNRLQACLISSARVCGLANTLETALAGDWGWSQPLHRQARWV
jgi:hypothetical protein